MDNIADRPSSIRKEQNQFKNACAATQVYPAWKAVVVITTPRRDTSIPRQRKCHIHYSIKSFLPANACLSPFRINQAIPSRGPRKNKLSTPEGGAQFQPLLELQRLFCPFSSLGEPPSSASLSAGDSRRYSTPGWSCQCRIGSDRALIRGPSPLRPQPPGGVAVLQIAQCVLEERSLQRFLGVLLALFCPPLL